MLFAPPEAINYLFMLPQRKPTRLAGFDYRSDRLYFITCCVKHLRHCFGEVIDGTMRLNDYGLIADQQWLWLAEQYSYDHIIRDARGYKIFRPIFRIIRRSGRRIDSSGKDLLLLSIRFTYRVFISILGVMIKGFKDKKTSAFAEGKFVRQFAAFKPQAERRLRILEAATGINDLVQLPSNRFEALSGDRRGQYSIRINQQWRICFTWPSRSDGPEDVEIVDYH